MTRRLLVVAVHAYVEAEPLESAAAPRLSLAAFAASKMKRGVKRARTDQPLPSLMSMLPPAPPPPLPFARSEPANEERYKRRTVHCSILAH